MMNDETPRSYDTPQDPRPTLATVLAVLEAAVAYWAEEAPEHYKLQAA